MFASGILWRSSCLGRLTVRMLRDERRVGDGIHRWITLEGWWVVAGVGVDRASGWVGLVGVR